MRSKAKAPSIGILSASHRRLSHDKYATLVGALMAASVIFSTTDLLTTMAAINLGLSEGNYMLIAFSKSLGLGLLPALELTKVLFLVGCFAVSMIGIRMRGSRTGLLAIALLTIFVLLQLGVSVNNLSAMTG